MKKTASILCTLALLTVSSQSFSQDDSSWWRKLFKKETVEEMKTEEPEEKPVPVPQDTVKILPIDAPVEVVHTVPSTLDRPGNIQVSTPTHFTKLDSSFRKNPPALEGYRIQIYFGDLEKARAIRTGFLNSTKAHPCYLEQNPPSFAVQVGDFRTSLDAHRALEEIKLNYPGALVVPAEIEIPR